MTTSSVRYCSRLPFFWPHRQNCVVLILLSLLFLCAAIAGILNHHHHWRSCKWRERLDKRSCVCAGWRGDVGTAVIGGSAIDVDGDVAPSIGAGKGLKFCLTDYSVHIDVAEHQRSLISFFLLYRRLN